MKSALIVVLLLIAAFLEVGGDAIVRMGLHAPTSGQRVALIAGGGLVLLAYGIFVNTAPADFGRLLGIYVAFFFVVAQIVNRVAFDATPTLAVMAGGALIVAGGAVMTVWR